MYLIIINSHYSKSNRVLQLFDASAKSPQFNDSIIQSTKAIKSHKRVVASDKK
jgi:hypothetical protein